MKKHLREEATQVDLHCRTDYVTVVSAFNMNFLKNLPKSGKVK